MSSKYTPGPWRYVPGKFNRDECANEYGSIQGIDESGHRGYWVATIEDAEEAEANARLIAAAPELLAACEDAERAIAGTMADSLSQRLRAAIAKATNAE
jgi:hypothetical protein